MGQSSLAISNWQLAKGQNRGDLTTKDTKGREGSAGKKESRPQLLFGLGILAEGELKQPADGLSTRLKPMDEPEFVEPLHQLRFQEQMNQH
jgi:hypothetical protein